MYTKNMYMYMYTKNMCTYVHINKYNVRTYNEWVNVFIKKVHVQVHVLN